ncbi:hypothetical protein JKP88DRAFT_255985 [Tribonema minus]|nr:hypothetical protein JKP88DRAFT_255985 [Tribonema minus]
MHAHRLGSARTLRAVAVAAGTTLIHAVHAHRSRSARTLKAVAVGVVTTVTCTVHAHRSGSASTLQAVAVAVVVMTMMAVQTRMLMRVATDPRVTAVEMQEAGRVIGLHGVRRADQAVVVVTTAVRLEMAAVLGPRENSEGKSEVEVDALADNAEFGAMSRTNTVATQIIKEIKGITHPTLYFSEEPPDANTEYKNVENKVVSSRAYSAAVSMPLRALPMAAFPALYASNIADPAPAR